MNFCQYFFSSDYDWIHQTTFKTIWSDIKSHFFPEKVKIVIVQHSTEVHSSEMHCTKYTLTALTVGFGNAVPSLVLSFMYQATEGGGGNII